MRVRRPPLRMTTLAAGVPNCGEAEVKVTVSMGIDKLWVKAEAEVDDYDDAHQGAILTHALMAVGDQAVQQLRDLSEASAKQAE